MVLRSLGRMCRGKLYLFTLLKMPFLYCEYINTNVFLLKYLLI